MTAGGEMPGPRVHAPVPSAGGSIVVLLAGLLLFVAVNLQAGWVYAVAALLVAVLLAGAVSAYLGVRGLWISRQAPSQAVEGEEIAVALAVRGARWPRFFVEVRDPGAGYGPVHAALPFLPAGRWAHLPLRAPALRRGVHRLRPLELRSQGLTGLFTARGRLESPGEVVIYPRHWALRRFPLPAHPGADAEAVSREDRAGPEVDGIREYREGDPLRHIHWRSTARRGTLVVRRFLREGSPQATLLLDARVEGGFEDLVRAAASILRFATDAGSPVRLITDQSGRLLDVAGGWSQGLDLLARVTTTGILSPAELYRQAAPSAGAVVVLSPDVDDVLALAGRAPALVAVIADGAPDHRAAGPAALRAMGIPSCLLHPGADIGRSLESCG